MSPYKVIDHTSDVGIKIEASSLEKLFSDAVDGLFFLLTDRSIEDIDISRSKIGRIRVGVKYNLIDSALIELLNRIILLTYSRSILIFNPIIRIKRSKVVLKGDFIKDASCLIEREIKAATYHNFSIRMREGLYNTTIIFDI